MKSAAGDNCFDHLNKHLICLTCCDQLKTVFTKGQSLLIAVGQGENLLMLS